MYCQRTRKVAEEYRSFHFFHLRCPPKASSSPIVLPKLGADDCPHLPRNSTNDQSFVLNRKSKRKILLLTMGVNTPPASKGFRFIILHLSSLSHFSRPRNKVPSISRVFVLIFVYRFLSTILDFLRLFCFFSPLLCYVQTEEVSSKKMGFLGEVARAPGSYCTVFSVPLSSPSLLSPPRSSPLMLA